MPHAPGDVGRAVCALLVFVSSSLAGELAVISVQPSARSLAAPINSPITVQFDRPVLRSSVTSASFWAFGRWSGSVLAPAGGTFSFSDGDRTVTLTPSEPFSSGEQVMVTLSDALLAADGSPLRAPGYSYQFWTRTRRALPEYEQIASMTTRTTPGQTTRSYGGFASDLNNDGHLDITIVNEDTDDLRVFLSRADGTGLFHPFSRPTFPVNNVPSPSEPTDFDRDGNTDICVANTQGSSVSVLLGAGDGTFGAQQSITVGSAPRGIAVLDADGDGDMDIANTNSGSNNMALLLNNGAGAFGAPAFFEGGASGEWALAASDMTGDGLLDLAIGARTSQQVVVGRANGDGTFTPMTPRACGGGVWMLACGDLNGDGTDDAATANSTSNNAGVLMGDGLGGLAPVQTFPTDPFPLADDLGDVDGDGDLDWAVSSFNGDWRLFINNGAGQFTFNQEFNAPSAASCALLLDFDNDRDLDLALIDEIADVVILMKNVTCHADLNMSGDVSIADFLWFLTLYSSGDPRAEFTGDDAVNVQDVLAFLSQFSAGCT